MAIAAENREDQEGWKDHVGWHGRPYKGHNDAPPPDHQVLDCNIGYMLLGSVLSSLMIYVLSRRIVYSIYYNSTLLLPVRGEGKGC